MTNQQGDKRQEPLSSQLNLHGRARNRKQDSKVEYMRQAMHIRAIGHPHWESQGGRREEGKEASCTGADGPAPPSPRCRPLCCLLCSLRFSLLRTVRAFHFPPSPLVLRRLLVAASMLFQPAIASPLGGKATAGPSSVASRPSSS